MVTVKIEKKKIWVDDHPISLLGGEAHYWRLDPANWQPILQRVHEMGIEVVATYVCWDFHEIRPGEYDFTGATNPRRNLLGFLDLLTAEGFWILLRPGPYIYAEWRNAGVPDDAARFHRLSPEFQERALPYMRAVTEAAKPYLATNGGRIILWQADNEIDPWPHWYTGQLGLGSEPGLFQEFLGQQYGEVAALNQAWRTTYTQFEQAHAVSFMFPNDTDRMRRYLDFVRFQHWFVNQVADWTTKQYRQLGIDVPVYLNAYSGVATQSWADLEALADLAGPDIYPSRLFAQRPNELRSLLETVRYTRTYSSLPYIAEFEAGIWHDWLSEVGWLPANHYRLMCFSALLAGVAGWNWYMLVNRDNWYQSPINEWGRTRPDVFAAFRQITSVFKELDPTSLVKQTHTAVTFDVLQRGTQRPGQDLLQSFFQADIDYEFFNFSRGECHQPVLFYAGGEWLSAAAQERLNQYVINGGILVCLGSYPKLDDQLHPLNLLGIQEPAGIISSGPGEIQLDVLGAPGIRSQWMYSYAEMPGEPIYSRRLPVEDLTMEENHLQFNLQTGKIEAIGYNEKRGRGRLMVIGLTPSPSLLLALHNFFNIQIPLRSKTSGVASALFQRDQEYYVIAVNNSSEDKLAELLLARELVDKHRWQVQNLVPGQENSVKLDNGLLTAPIPAKDGIVLRLKGY